MDPILDADSGRTAILRRAVGVRTRWVHQSIAVGRTRLLDTTIDHVSQWSLDEVLEIDSTNRSHAARLAGASRPTLLAKPRKYRLEQPSIALLQDIIAK